MEKDLSDIRADAEVFLAAICGRFDCEYGISKDDAVEGLIALYRAKGSINYAQEKSIRAEIEAENIAAFEAAQTRRQEQERINPQWAQMEKQLQEMSRRNLDHIGRGFITSVLGYDPYAAHEARKESIRQWWSKNGVTL